MNNTTSIQKLHSYIINIDEDYKIIYNSDIDNNNIIKYLNIFYPFNNIIVYNLCNNPILKYINNNYNFIINKRFDINIFCDNINYFNDFIDNDNMFKLSYNIDNIKQELNNNVYIYYNNYFNDIIITNISKPNIFNEFTLIYNGIVNDLEELILLQDNIYNNIEVAKYDINKIINKDMINTKLSVFELKELLHKYFYMDNNKENKIKFSDIWEILLLKQNINEEYQSIIKKQLPKALEEMGLNKKRLTSGIYWYGLVLK